MLQIALIVAISYAVLDWKYVKAGGQRVTHSERLAWIISVGTLSVLTIAALDINGGVLILMLAFMVYEARRWRVRRKHPLQGQQQPDHPALNPLEQAPVNRSMKLNVVRGFRRLAWVIVVLSIPVAMFVSYETSMTFAGYSKELLAAKYPNLLKVDDDKLFTAISKDYPDIAKGISDAHFLSAEELATLESVQAGWRRSTVEELRRSGSFPYGREVEVKKLDKTAFVTTLIGIVGGIAILLHGAISVIAWIGRGFKQTPG